MTLGELRGLLLEHLPNVRAEHPVVVEATLDDGTIAAFEVTGVRRNSPRQAFVLAAVPLRDDDR